MEAPETTNRYINGLNPEMDLEILAEGARQSRALILTEWAAARGIGTITPDRWDTLQHQMERAGVREPGAVEAVGAFGNAFLDGAAPQDKDWRERLYSRPAGPRWRARGSGTASSGLHPASPPTPLGPATQAPGFVLDSSLI